MKHPSPSDLAAFGLGKLPGPSADTVVAHLETCVERRGLSPTSGRTVSSIASKADAVVTLLRR